MTREEAIKHIMDIICENNSIKPSIVTFEQEKEALYMAISALEQGSCTENINGEYTDRKEREEAIAYIKGYRKLDEDLHNTAPKDSISYYATDKCLKYWDMAISALEQEPCIYDLKNRYCPKTHEEIYMQGFYKAKEIFMSELQGKKFIKQEPCGSTYGGVSWGGTYKPQEPCEDAISREVVLNSFEKHCGELNNYIQVWEEVEQLPSVTPSRKGHWIEHEKVYECSECNIIRAKGTTGKYNYCPSCGAEMVEQKESDHKCHTCKHYTSGERDGSCDSYICKHYSDWESEDKE